MMMKFSKLTPIVGTPLIAGPWTLETEDLVIPRTAGSWLFPADEVDEFGFGLLAEFRLNVFSDDMGSLALVARPVYSIAGEAAGDDWGFSSIEYLGSEPLDAYIASFDWDKLFLTDDVAVMDSVIWGPLW